ncbi:MAG: hypothetical protein JNM57_00365 [Cyclobacteriaceae bacterium]|nr:hypothetical protein [Cyclobacteriaceae bacterium]
MPKTILRLLSFRITREELLQLDNKHLLAGLIGTWIVGMGRYWDDPGAKILQHAGLGSVIYIFCLSFFIWLVIKPYWVKHWNYFSVLTFVSLTSFPAIVYAIPVEQIWTKQIAIQLNVTFLLVVASWRLGLLYFFLKRFTKLPHGYILVGTLVPICVIIVTLTALNLERAVFDIMGGLREKTGKDKAYEVLIMLTFISSIISIPVLLGYAGAIVLRWKHRKQMENS